MSGSMSRLQRQKEFYDLLQHLGNDKNNDIEQQLVRALTIIVEMSGARQAYLEIRGLDDDRIFQSFSMSEDEVDTVRETISSGIIAQAIQSGEPIVTSTAFLDPRFNALESVRMSNIESVFCAPFNGSNARGVIYLQGDASFDPQSGRVKLEAQAFTRHVVPFLDQLLLEYEQQQSFDPTFVLRKRFRLQSIIGSSEALYRVLQAGMTVASLDVNVLISGESGTGKTQLAHAIHLNSIRAKHPFVELNCGAMQDTLVESELFGTVRGAFNDAQDKPGKILAAGEGTLFLDEVSELSQSAQTKLLQFLQSGEFYPVGSEKKVRSDARVLCASNQYLEELVHKGQFRKDLYFRINTFPIHMPSLAERKEDITLLAEHFCQIKCIKHGFGELGLSSDLLEHLRSRNWPGNIRELDNLIETGCIHAVIDDSTSIELRHVVDINNGLKTSTGYTGSVDSFIGLSFQDATKSFQKEFLLKNLKTNSWDVQKTGTQLGLSKSHMYNLIKEFELSNQ